MSPLVSIIIPTYNRATLIRETLDSILTQTHTNWECIVVDDGSTDDSEKVIGEYVKKDARFRFHKRPKDRPKGANACRNYGFELSEGEFVNWFDSDDLMHTDNLALKVSAFTNDIDFVIGNTINFDEFGKTSRPYKLNYDYPIDVEKFVAQQIGWITNDVLLRKSVLHEVTFNEKLKFGQEYNFFSRFLYKNNKGCYLKKDIAQRRIHSGSITTAKLASISTKKDKDLFWHENLLLNDIYNDASEKSIKRSIRRLLRFSYESQAKFRVSKNQIIMLKWLLKLKMYQQTCIYLLWILTNLMTGKGYLLLKKIKI